MKNEYTLKGKNLLPSFWKGLCSKRKEFAPLSPFQKGHCAGKQTRLVIWKVASLVKNGGKSTITKTRLYKYIVNFTAERTKILQMKNCNVFLISAQNIDCGYSLEPPQRGGCNEVPTIYVLGRNKKNNVYPCKPQFYYIKVGFKGVRII